MPSSRERDRCGSESPYLNANSSPLSTLGSHQSSFDSNDATVLGVKYSWSGGLGTPSNISNESEESGVVAILSGETTEDIAVDGSTNSEGSAGQEVTLLAVDTRGNIDNKGMVVPKVGTSNRKKKKVGSSAVTASRNEERISSSDTKTTAAYNQNLSQTSSWDIQKTFSFSKKKVNKESSSNNNRTPSSYHHKGKELQHPYHRPTLNQSSKGSGIWDLMHASIGGLSRSDSMSTTANNIYDDSKNNQGMKDVEGCPPPLSESQENSLFAMEVGLMYSNDDGDTILGYSQTLSASYTIESEVECHDSPSTYDLSKYLKYQHENNGTTNMNINNDIGWATSHDSESVYTNTQSVLTVRDDFGNRVPENCKTIMGYDMAKRRKTGNNDNGSVFSRNKKPTEAIFPTMQIGGGPDTAAVPPEEMERRLRELAGQISSDWRDTDPDNMTAPALARRLRDFQFAREKRRRKYGNSKLWGILGLYDHLSGVKLDVEWAEDAAWRRTNKQPYLKWADYESMKNDGFNRPFFTYLVVSACTAMMVTSIYLNGWKFEPLSVNPMIGPSSETLLKLGAKDSYLIVVQQEIWRIASPMVLHAGLIHFFLNMFALWFVGKAIEQMHGFFPAVVQFVVSAVGGTILSAIFLPEYITVGASGGIFGLIGGCIADIIMNWGLLFNEFVNERGQRLSHAKVLIVLLLDIVLNCLIGLTPFVDNFTHLGGMIYGFLCGLSTIQLVSPKFFGDERQCFHKFKILFFRSFGLLVCMSGIIASSVFLFSGDGETNPCTTCTYMSCMTFPPWNEKTEKWWFCDSCELATAEGTLDTTTGKFTKLSINCPSSNFTVDVDVDTSWPQQEKGLEEMLPSLCRAHC